MFGITAFAEAPFTSLGGVSVLIEATGVSATANLSDPTQVAATVVASAVTTATGSSATSASTRTSTS